MPGYHLPFLAAGANGLFAEFGLEVEILEPAGGPENVRRVAAGGADFCLTSVTHYLRALSCAQGPLGARFVSVVVRRSPLAAFVADGSPLAAPADLGGRRLGGSPASGMVAEFRAGLAALGLEPPVVVPVEPGPAPVALAGGAVDAVCEFVDTLPRVRRQAGVPVRAIPLGTEVYSSGLVAADRLSADVVTRMQAAVAAALERQRLDPRAGLPELARRYPEADPIDALEGWSLAEPNILTGPPPGQSDPAGWAATVAHLAAAHGLAAPDPETVYRRELIGASPLP